MTSQQLDTQKAEAFAGQMLGILNGAALTLLTSIGHQTGLFDTMAGQPPSTSQQVADAAKLNERYVREWLGAMVTGRIVEYDPVGRTYRLPPEHAAALTRAAADALRRHRVEQAQERLLLDAAWEDNDLVFADEMGRPVSPWILIRHFQALLAKADLPKIRFHDLRHTAATLLLGQGVHPKIVSEMLGHSNIATTLDLYSHVTPVMQRQAADVMDAVLAGS